MSKCLRFLGPVAVLSMCCWCERSVAQTDAPTAPAQPATVQRFSSGNRTTSRQPVTSATVESRSRLTPEEDEFAPPPPFPVSGHSGAQPVETDPTAGEPLPQPNARENSVSADSTSGTEEHVTSGALITSDESGTTHTSAGETSIEQSSSTGTEALPQPSAPPESVSSETSQPVTTHDSTGSATVETDASTSFSLPVPVPAPPIEETNNRLPVKLDRSSTAAQTQQLMKFEMKNQIAEAFLLAGELLRQNPNEEFAFDAVIRTSLILRQNDDVEKYYREAIRRTPLPGKYYVQLAHFFSRSAQDAKLKKLVLDFEKQTPRPEDYWVTLARLRTITGEFALAREAAEKAVLENVTAFPLTALLIRTARLLDEPEPARKSILTAGQGDFGPWEKRTLLLELVKTSGATAEEIGIMFREALVNESSYDRANSIARIIMEQALKQRTFHALRRWFGKRIQSGEAADMEVWFAAMMDKKQGNTVSALELLTSDTSALTPVIAYERALSFVDTGATSEALPILEELLAEQPLEHSLRLLTAEQYLQLGQSKKCMQTLQPISPAKLSSDQRLKYCELIMAAAVAAGQPDQILTTWIEIAQAATFADIQAMGDIIVRAAMTKEARERLSTFVAERYETSRAPALLLLRARLCANEGNHDAELEFYTEYLRQDSKNTQMMRFVAELAAQYSVVPLKIISGKRPENSTSITLRASHGSRSDLALDLYRKLIGLQPMISDHYSAMIRIYRARGEIDFAKRVAVELAESNTSSSEVQTMAAIVLDQNAMPAESLYFYRSALRLNPDEFSTWIRYATALTVSRRFSEAEAVYKKILENGMYGKPYDQPEVLKSLLRVATESGTVPGLVMYLDSLRGREIPGRPEFYLSAAKLFMQIQEYPLAESFLQDFQKRFPENKLLADSYLLLGQLYYARKELDQAAEVFQEVAEKFAGGDQAITAAFNVGELRRQAGRHTDAIDLWTKLATSFPQNDKAVSGLYEAAVVAYGELKDNDRTAKLLQQYIDADPQDFKLLQKARESLRRLEATRSEPLPKPKAAAAPEG